MFIAASSATYVFNDLRDVEYDRQHPVRRLRPLAAGEVERGTAMRLALALTACARAARAAARQGDVRRASRST